MTYRSDMKITIHSEEELIQVTKELVHVLCNLRKFSKLWEQEYGVKLKERKKYYEAKADELIERLQVPEHRQVGQIKIEINNGTNI